MPSGPSPWGVLGGPSALLGRVQGQSRARRQARRQWWDIGTSRRDPAPRSASTRPSGRNPSGPADLQPQMMMLFICLPIPPLFTQQPLPSQSRPPKSQATVHKSQTVASAVLCRSSKQSVKTGSMKHCPHVPTSPCGVLIVCCSRRTLSVHWESSGKSPTWSQGRKNILNGNGRDGV